MGYLDESLPLELPLVDSSIIKVIGVGGGGAMLLTTCIVRELPM